MKRYDEAHSHIAEHWQLAKDFMLSAAAVGQLAGRREVFPARLLHHSQNTPAHHKNKHQTTKPACAISSHQPFVRLCKSRLREIGIKYTSWWSGFDSSDLAAHTLHFIEWWLPIRVPHAMENFLKLLEHTIPSQIVQELKRFV
jgi:hypothetical protein